MKKRILILIAIAVSGLAFVLGRTSAKASLAEGAVQAPVNCAIAKTNFEGCHLIQWRWELETLSSI